MESQMNNNEDGELIDIIAEYSKGNVNDKVDDGTFYKNDCHKKSGYTDEENAIEKALFGNKAQLIQNLKTAVNKKGLPKQYIKDIEPEDEVKGKIKPNGSKRKPVWTDDDDENLLLCQTRKSNLDHLDGSQTYKDYVTKKFTRICKDEPKWITLAKHAKKNGNKKQKPNDEKESDTSDDSDELLRTVGFLNKNAHSVNLPSHYITLKKLKDLNRATYAEGFINCIDFHPTSTAALVAGDNCVASIYAVDGINNAKLHNIHIPNFPVKCAKILPCGTKAILGSVTRYAYIYDLLTAQESCYKLRRDYGLLHTFKVSYCGKYIASCGLNGNVHLWETNSFELLHTFKQNTNGANLCFTNDSQPRLITTDRSPNVYIFSIHQRRLEHTFIDDGCITGSVIDLSPNQRLLATGSMEGVVNVYDFQKIITTLPTNPQPEKIFLNLKTAISHVTFNHNSELLGFCSGRTSDAVKLAHFPSATVFSNFPNTTAYKKLGKIRTLSFSPHSGFMALGTLKAIPLYRLKHYKNY